MKCPRCDTDAKVLDTREAADLTTRRRLECERGHRFSTVEVHAPHPLHRPAFRQLLRTIAARIQLTKGKPC